MSDRLQRHRYLRPHQLQYLSRSMTPPQPAAAAVHVELQAATQAQAVAQQRLQGALASESAARDKVEEAEDAHEHARTSREKHSDRLACGPACEHDGSLG